MSAGPFLSTAGLAGLVADLVDARVGVFGPVLDRAAVEFRRIRTAADVSLDTGALPRFPLKALFLPPTEALFSWRQQRGDVELVQAPPDSRPAVVVGARPCDAAALDVLDRVMGWDYRDEPWFARRAATTLVTVACATPGPDCFCHRVGLGPAARRGSDILLVPVEGGYRTNVVTEKGAALRDRFASRFAQEGTPETSASEDGVSRGEEAAAGPFDLVAVRAWLDGHFEAPLWEEVGLRCHGCGACASVCPTCHCFDIVDEPDGLLSGTRRRTWDTCQSGKFTLHASGHNPRADQGARFRQRVMHKFAVYPARFDAVLCTGCGRCTRACAAGQHLPQILETIERAAGAPPAGPVEPVATTKTTA